MQTNHLNKLAAAALFYSAAVFSAEVNVESSGKTFEEAKRNGFRSAIERATGVLTISEQEVSGYKLTRDYVGSYSSGWVNSYVINDALQDVNGQWIVKMQVDVRDSKIKSHSERRNTMNAVRVNGEQISTRLSSQQEQRSQGDQLLSVVFRSYPEHAYEIVQTQTSFSLDKTRNPYMDVDYDLSLSKSWVVSLNDALAAIAVDEKQCNTLSMVMTKQLAQSSGNGTKRLVDTVCGNEPDVRVFIKYEGDWFPKAYNYFLADESSTLLINSFLQPRSGRPYVGLKLDLQDGNGRTFDSKCTNIDVDRFINYSDPKGVYNYNQMKSKSRPNFMGQNLLKGSVRVYFTKSSDVESLSQVKLSIQNSC